MPQRRAWPERNAIAERLSLAAPETRTRQLRLLEAVGLPARTWVKRRSAWSKPMATLGSILLRYHLAVSGATGRRFYLSTDAHADPILIGCATACLVSWWYIRGVREPSATTR